MFRPIIVLITGFLEMVMIAPNKYMQGIFNTFYTDHFQADTITISQIISMGNWNYLISCFFVPFVVEWIGMRWTKVTSAVANTIALIAASFTDNVWIQIGLQHFIFYCVAIADITVSIIAKENFSKERLPVVLSILKSASGLGTFLQTVSYGFLLKYFNFQIVLITVGIINNLVLLVYFLLVPDIKPIEVRQQAQSEPLVSQTKVIYEEHFEEDLPFMSEMMKSSVILSNLAILFQFVSFKLIQEWAIKFVITKDLSWDEGSYILWCLSITSIFGRLFSGFVAQNMKIYQLFMILFTIVTVAQLLFAFVDNQYVLLFAGAMQGFVPGSTSAQIGMLVRDIHCDKWYGRGLGFMSTTCGLAMVIGGQITPLVIQLISYNAIFLIYASCTVCSFVLIYLAMYFKNLEIEVEQLKIIENTKKKNNYQNVESDKKEIEKTNYNKL